MRVITLKNGEKILITENEFESMKEALGSPGFINIFRLQEIINTFEVSTISPVFGQLEYGSPYIRIENGEIDGNRYFKDKNSGLFFYFSPQLGRMQIPEVSSGGMTKEDEYLDNLAKNALPKPKTHHKLPPATAKQKTE